MYKESSFEVSMFLGGVLCEIIGPNLDELGRSLVIFLGENEEFSLWNNFFCLHFIRVFGESVFLWIGSILVFVDDDDDPCAIR